MKRIFPILLSLFVLLQSGILSFQYVIELVHHKMTIEAGLSSGVYNNQLITFNSSELFAAEWENEHEFFLGGEKYDVVSKSGLKGSFTYQCINDKTEKTLMNNLERSEKKSTLIEDLIKKINLHVITIEKFEVLSQFNEENIRAFFSPDTYCFIFLRFINKPPAN